MLSRFFGGTIFIVIDSSKISLFQRPAKWQRQLDNCHKIKQIEIEGDTSNSTCWERSFRLLLDAIPLTGIRCHAIIDDQLLRYFTVTPAGNTRSLRDCKDAAKARFQVLYGEDDQDWKIQANWQQNAPFLSCAIPTYLTTTLKQVLTEHHLQILSLQPKAIALWNYSKVLAEEGDWIMFFNGHHLLVIIIKQRKLSFLDKTLLPQDSLLDNKWLSHYIEQIILRHSISTPNTLHIYGVIPPRWISALNIKVIEQPITLFPCSELT